MNKDKGIKKSRKIAYTVANIIKLRGVSERTVIRRLAKTKPATHLIIKGRKARAWTREQVAAAFAKA